MKSIASLLFPERYRLALSDRGFALARARALSGALVSHDACISGLVEPGDQAGLFAQIEQAFKAEKARRPVVDLMLGGGLTRIAVVPWHEAATGEQDHLALAEEALEPLIDSTANWKLLMEEQKYGSPRSVCAIPASVLESVRALISGMQGKIRKTETTFALALKCWLKSIELDKDAIFLLVEEDLLTAVWCRVGGGAGWVRRFGMGDMDSENLLNDLCRHHYLCTGAQELPSCFALALGRNEASNGLGKFVQNLQSLSLGTKRAAVCASLLLE